jgi:hypothetical protein
VGALQAHVGVAAVQECGCRAAWRLATSAEGKAALLAVGGGRSLRVTRVMELARAAARRHPDHVGVQKMSAGLFGCF